MKTILIMAAASLLPLATPTFAQTPDASRAHRHHHRHIPHAGYQVNGAQSSYGSDDVYVRPYRAPVIPAPAFAWRPETQQEGVGADLIGPGSSAENPTGQYDVSR